MSDTAAAPGDTIPSSGRRSVLGRTIHLIVTPAPGRLRNTLILVAGVLLTTAIWEVFRIPEATVACYVILFVSRDNRATTAGSALGIAAMGIFATLLTIAVLMATLSEPALRFWVMVVLTFVVMFMSRAAKAGPAFFAIGFILVYGLAMADSVGQAGLQPATVSNTTGTSLPDILFMPNEEALLHTVLWLTVCFLVPGATVVLLNKAFGRDPAVLLRNAVATRLHACAGFCEGRPGAATQLVAVARRGSPEMLLLVDQAAKDHGAKAEPPASNRAAVRAVARLVLACVAWHEIHPGEASGTAARPDWMAAAARRCRALAEDGPAPEPGSPDAAARGDPFGTEVHQALDDLGAARRDRGSAPDTPKAEAGKGFWGPDAFAAANAQFGLKVTLAVMTCYTLNNALDWPQIGTSVVTCFFVALGSLGESLHKMTLRISGCLVGAGLGIAAVILLMPVMTDLPDLLALMAVATFLFAWVACGSERISYAGWQMAFAFYTVVLQGFGPTTDMESAKNRIIGILLGLVVSTLVMTTIWPVPVQRQVSASLADAMSALARLLRGPDSPVEVRERFSVAASKAQSLLGDSAFEVRPPDRIRAAEELAERVQALVIPVAMLARSKARAYPDAVAAWLDDTAGWVRDERRRTGSLPPAPSRPEAPDGEADAYALMQRELSALPLRRLDAPAGQG